MAGESDDWRSVEIGNPQDRYHVKFWLGEHDIVFAEAVGYEEIESSRKVVQIMAQYRRRLGKKIRVCLDATGFTGMDPEGRKYMRDATLGNDSSLERFAVVGGNFFSRNLFNMYAVISSIPMRVHKTKEAAVSWLVER
jgi:hypothetical protein